MTDNRDLLEKCPRCGANRASSAPAEGARVNYFACGSEYAVDLSSFATRTVKQCPMPVGPPITLSAPAGAIQMGRPATRVIQLHQGMLYRGCLIVQDDGRIGYQAPREEGSNLIDRETAVLLLIECGDSREQAARRLA